MSTSISLPHIRRYMRSRSGALNVSSFEELLEEMKLRDENAISTTLDKFAQLRLDEQELELLDSIKPAKATAKVLVLGEAGVGKTSIVNRFVNKFFNETYQPSNGMQVTSRLASLEDKAVKLEIWDAPTSKHLAPLVKSYYPSVKAFLVVFDMSSPTSLEFAMKCLEGLPLRAPRVLVGNKADIAQDSQRLQAREMAGLAEAGYIETSARTGFNIESLFLDLAANC
mmetsp:Transcript_31570/g.54692  ORF Transcript_31570/g.54692 Transcript_31570/m.54692 type:complete len:226 (-) Transcript_31570:53-730(-)